MSLSTCDVCGGFVQLGPEAANRCQTCGEPVFPAGSHNWTPKTEGTVNPYKNLCYYDERNPDRYSLDEDDKMEPRRPGCACDNCFYGRDPLALEVIRLRKALGIIG